MQSALACIALAVLLAAVPATQALSPPWNLFATQIKAGLAVDTFAKVAIVDGDKAVTVDITVSPCCSASRRRLNGAAALPCIKDCAKATSKAKAFATLLTASTAAASKGWGNQVKVRVTQGKAVVAPGAPPKSTSGAATMFRQAMLGCTLFKGMGAAPMTNNPLAIFEPKVVQYWADDLSQLNGVQSKVAAELFGEVFNLPAYQISATSQPCNGKDCPVPTA